MQDKYKQIGTVIGTLVDQKNKQYGDSFNQAGDVLEILYPNGVKPEQYKDMLAVVRVVDKLFRVAHGKQGNEDPWQDIAGYGLLGMGKAEIRKDCSDCMFYYDNEDYSRHCVPCKDFSNWVPAKPEITGGD